MAEPACLEKGNSCAPMGSELRNCRPQNEHAAKEKEEGLPLKESEIEVTLASLGEKKLGL